MTIPISNELKAVRLLSCWERSKRPTVSVSLKEYKELLYKVPVLFVAAEQKTGNVMYVVLDRLKATQHLKAENNLHSTKVSTNGLR